ncbi:MAG: DUF3794 domain-containing protein [Bariatricus sp.]|nr:DUF3794 domain-containing protein [Bariatricus sp.]
MELIRKKVRTNALGKTVVDQFAIDDDFNVPDSKNDVGRVIYGEGKLKIEETRKVDNYLRISGKLYFRVLYAEDTGEMRLSSLEGRIPFEEMVYIEENTAGDYVVQQSRIEFTASVIHSRKLSVKAVAELAVHIEYTEDSETTVDVEDDGKLYKKLRPLQILQLTNGKRDIYRIKEEITIPGTKENIGTLLWNDTALRKLDTRLVQDALIVNGELLVFCFYESQDGKLDWVEQTVPFEGKVECRDADENIYHHVYTELSDVNVEIRMDEDGEMRILGIEAALEMRILIYEEENTTVLEDAYSLAEECVLERKETIYEELLMQNHSKCKLTEQLTLPELKEEILQICHSGGSMQVEHMEVVPEGIQIEGILHVSFLYVKANDGVPFDVWQGIVPFSYLLESGKTCPDMRYDLTYNVEQLAIDLAGNDEVEIKAVLSFNSFLRNPIRADVITSIELRPYDKALMGRRPGITGYVVKKGDDLWSLAKRYFTTKEGIMEINEMSSEVLKEGEKILIFKENMSIL